MPGLSLPEVAAEIVSALGRTERLSSAVVSREIVGVCLVPFDGASNLRRKEVYTDHSELRTETARCKDRVTSA
jgi:hypothetical protein